MEKRRKGMTEKEPKGVGTVFKIQETKNKEAEILRPKHQGERIFRYIVVAYEMNYL